MLKKIKQIFQNLSFLGFIIIISNSLTVFAASDARLADVLDNILKINADDLISSQAFREILPQPSSNPSQEGFFLNEVLKVPEEHVAQVLLAFRQFTRELIKIANGSLESANGYQARIYTLTAAAVLLGAIFPPLLAKLQTLESPLSWFSSFDPLSYSLPLEDVRLLCKAKENNTKISEPFFMDSQVLERVIEGLQDELKVSMRIQNIHIDSKREANFLIDDNTKRLLSSMANKYIKVALNDACMKTEENIYSRESQKSSALIETDSRDTDGESASFTQRVVELKSTDNEEEETDIIEYNISLFVLSEDKAPLLNKSLSFLKGLIWTSQNDEMCHSDSHKYHESCQTLEFKF
jgi:hypothetical protein